MANTIYTHSGLWHADEIFGCAIAHLAGFGPQIQRVRELPESFSPEEGDVAVDIGSRFDPTRNKYDHHYPGGNDDGLSSAGKIWSQYGAQICGGDHRAAARVSEVLIASVDRTDCGIHDWKPIRDDWRHLSASAFFSAMNQPFGTPPDEVQAAFEVAVQAAALALKAAAAQAQLFFTMYDVVRTAQFEPGQQYLVLSRPGPWQEHLFADPKFESVLYVLFPSDRGGFQCQCVPDKLGSFGKKKSLPRSWKGLRGQELADVLASEGLGEFSPTSPLFCHDGLFVAGAETLEETLRLAQAAIAAEEVTNA